jgi:hypothetical protein
MGKWVVPIAEMNSGIANLMMPISASQDHDMIGTANTARPA